MIPIRDTIPSRHAPLMTWLIIAANLVVFLYELRLDPDDLERLVQLYGIVPARLGDPEQALRLGFPAGGYGTLLTSQFLHGGWLHVLGNMWTLWIFGDNVEDRMGPLRFLAFYLLGGVVAGALHWAVHPGSTTPTIGASGAIAAVLAAYFVLYPRSRVLTLVPVLFYAFFVELPAVTYLGLWFVMQLLSGMAAMGQADVGGVAWWAHLGGFGAGLLLHRLFLSRRRERRAYRGSGW